MVKKVKRMKADRWRHAENADEVDIEENSSISEDLSHKSRKKQANGNGNGNGALF